ncbi:secretion-regulating guanine nucleotide exchange factor-like [Physella acuta]|uniref:secretion-regulating guanine nucleotide exchange factor-like n=1 Tax=Physella acuta TaxID=109671 RepID=UPI0027DBC550|nr:secretion-regulating guanine nucleotide exchange factor-like [Physella acuta]
MVPVKTSPRDEMVQVKTSPRDEMVQVKTSPRDEMVQVKTSPRDEMVQMKTSPGDEMVQVKTSPRDEVVQVKTSPRDEMVQVKTSPRDEMVPVKTSPSDSSSATAADITGLGGGGAFSYLLTASGDLLTCGNNAQGQTAQASRTRSCVFSLSSQLSNFRLVKVSAGWDYMLALTDQGLILSWGSNTFGQLGRPAGGSDMPEKIQDLADERHVDIAAGLRHALSLTDTGHVYTWGHGRRGQLGLGLDNKLILSSHKPIAVKFPQGQIPTHVSAGQYCSGFCTGTGQVYMWGCNKFGQCHVSPAEQTLVAMATRVSCTLAEQKRFVDISCGWSHIVVKTDEGDLYSWGRGDLGQLGRACDQMYEHILAKIDGIPSIRFHTCGSEHTLAVAANGAAYSWGWNEHGICGTGNEHNVFYPYKLPFSNKVTQVGCGAGHSFCLVMES